MKRGLMLLSDTVVPLFEPCPGMNPSAFPAAKLPDVERKNLAILALAGTTTVSELAGFCRFSEDKSDF